MVVHPMRPMHNHGCAMLALLEDSHESFRQYRCRVLGAAMAPLVVRVPPLFGQQLAVPVVRSSLDLCHSLCHGVCALHANIAKVCTYSVT